MKIKKNLYPAGGYFFIEKDGTRIKSGSWGSLERAVREYRTRNHLPVGDVSLEVVQQACARNPTLCFEPGRKAPAGPTRVSPNTLKSRVLQWLADLVRRKGAGHRMDQVPAPIAAQRFSICRSCPNYRVVQGGCSACLRAVETSRKEILGRVERPGDLSACEHFGCDLPTACLLNGTADETSSAPDNCWRKKL